ncbi:hypothetical protein [Ostreibacterium oceani]|uniref:Uncharacterized protein n=1 Tax=Ostreibacterium oceani TaxID=2654998 RepID=A0A6N7ETH7_9GAMM|nr:hypothetical protein [Ostreibacterium oceani]MPV85243.1 hypothetical protein [Ostreibacterium oceani]
MKKILLLVLVTAISISNAEEKLFDQNLEKLKITFSAPESTDNPLAIYFNGILYDNPVDVLTVDINEKVIDENDKEIDRFNQLDVRFLRVVYSIF